MINSFTIPNGATPILLAVEDSDEDFEAFQRLLKRRQISLPDGPPPPVPVYRCITGDQALAFLYRTGPYSDPQVMPRPGLILLDLNIPGIDGREVLRRIKQDDTLKRIPVVIFTTSNNPKDINYCYQQGVNTYIIKPINFNQLKRSIQTLIEYWFEISTLPEPPEDLL